MLKKSCVVLSVLLLLSGLATAGEIKVHKWFCKPVDICDIDVVMDIGYWIHIVNQCDTIKLVQKTIHTYEGCLDLIVETNFPAHLDCSVSPTGAVPGDYTCTITDADIDPPGAPPDSAPTICVRLENADLSGQIGGTKDLVVAIVTVVVTPQL